MGRCINARHRQRRRQQGDDLDDPCTYCAAAIREGIFNPDLLSIDPALRNLAARFWTHLEVPLSDDPAILLLNCWSFDGPKRLMLGSRSFTPPQLIYTICWGDQGPWRIEHICDHSSCVNPFHLRVAELGHPPADMLLPWPQGFDDALDRITACNRQAADLLGITDTLPAPEHPSAL